MTRAIGHRLPDTQETILKHLRAGDSFANACEAAGISPKTGYKWLARGEGRGAAYSFTDDEPPDIYAAFAQNVRQAIAVTQLQVVREWIKEIPGNWQAARDFLARRFPQEWGNVERRQIEVDAPYRQLELELFWDDPAPLEEGARPERKHGPGHDPTTR